MQPSSFTINSSRSEFLETIEVFLLDLDGTLYLGDHLIPGACEFIAFLQEREHRFLILTNNSSKDPAAYQVKLQTMGIQVTLDQIFTSGDSTIYSINNKYPGARVFIAGTDHLKQLFHQSGYAVVDSDPEVVILGFDTGITYDTLRQTCDLVRSGLPYFATHPDLNCPVESGYIPDTGAFIAFIAAATGRQPDEICGKPFPAMVAAIGERMNCPADKMVMVGDRMNTDIALGTSGIRTILVLSGETSNDDLRRSDFKPDLILPSVAELHMILAGLQK